MDWYVGNKEHEKAALRYPNFLKIAEDGILEIYCDNHILSSLRKCEGYFEESILNSRSGKGKSWSLEFGIWLHKCMEFFYQAHAENWRGFWSGIPPACYQANNVTVFNHNVTNWLKICEHYWKKEYNLDDFATFKQYKALNGWLGSVQLLLEYYTTHTDGQERLRVVGQELGFGRAKEVPIVGTPYERRPFRAYLTGRIDIIVDNGTVIGPMDHKTTAYFDGSEASGFKPHDGMCGYAYTVNKLLGEKYAAQGRACNSIVINHICLKEMPKPGDRFKRSFPQYTPAEFAEYERRMSRSFRRLYDIVVLGETPDWNTEMCRMMWYKDCPYATLHELAPVARPKIAEQFYTIREAWNPYKND